MCSSDLRNAVVTRIYNYQLSENDFPLLLRQVCSGNSSIAPKHHIDKRPMNALKLGR